MNILQPASEALLALRRTLFQLAALGLIVALGLWKFAPGSGAAALWCALVPLSACAAHCRSLPAALLPARNQRSSVSRHR